MRPASWQTTALLAVAVTVTSCVPREPPEPMAPPPPPPPKILYEEVLNPIERPALTITNVVETANPDGTTVTVSGTLVNHGSGSTQQVSVRVAALNADGVELFSAGAVPSTERIAPDSTATFAVTLEKRPGVNQYHVEAIAR